MHIHQNRGFTLIELLVVIAIIGILSAVVLASLSTARSKGNDAAAQSDLSTIQVQAEIYYSNNNSYGATTVSGGGNTCPTTASMWADANVKSAVTGANSASTGPFISCNSNSSAYAIQVKLSAPAATPYWCVDSSGKAALSNTQLANNVTTCP